MNNRAIMVLVAFLCGGCSSYRTVTAEERETLSPQERIYKLELRNGEVLDLTGDPLGHGVLKAEGIERFRADGSIVTIPVAAVRTMYTRETTVLSSAGSVILISAVVAGILYVALGSINFSGL